VFLDAFGITIFDPAEFVAAIGESNFVAGLMARPMAASIALSPPPTTRML
jgi:hypothetical protein